MSGEGATTKRRITAETEIRVTDDFDLDDVFLETISSSNLMEVEFGADGDVDSFRIDPRVLRSVLALYSAQERTRHDWR